MTALKKDGTPHKRVPRAVATAGAAKQKPATKKALKKAPKKAPAGARTSTATKEVAKAKSAAETPQMPTVTVTFLGRDLLVKIPEVEQLIAWETLAEMSDATHSIDDAKRVIKRMQRIIDSVVVSENDREWMIDGRLDGTITVENSSQIILDALETFKAQAAPNRAARRKRD
jgi:hypothetical protein